MDPYTQHDLFELLASRIGIRLLPYFQYSTVERFINSRIRVLKLDSPVEYIQFLARQSLVSEEFSRLIASVTNTHTFFFRDTEQFRAMYHLLWQWRRANTRPLYVWSAGCATGEEPYSVAMITADLSIPVHILATDINRDALMYAPQARYNAWSLRHLPSSYRERFFIQEGDSFKLCDNLRQGIKYQFHNLVDNIYPRPPAPNTGWDLILCRNVLIYFDRDLLERIALAFAAVLGSEGYLFLSATENLRGITSSLTLVPLAESFAYQLNAPSIKSTTPKSITLNGDIPFSPVEKDVALNEPTIDSFPLSENDITQEFDNQQPFSVAIEGAETQIITNGGEAVENNGDEQSEAEYQDVIQLLDNGEWEKARRRLQEILKNNPNHLLAQITLGNIYLRTQAFEQALATYQRAQSHAPLLPEVHYFQGIAYRKLGDVERAIHAFRQALFLQPDFWCASFMLAGIYQHLGEVEHGRRYLLHTLSIIEKENLPHLFVSYIKGIKDVELLRSEVLILCQPSSHT